MRSLALLVAVVCIVVGCAAPPTDTLGGAAPSPMLDAWDTDVSGNFLAMAGWSFTTWDDSGHTVFAYPTADAQFRQAYRDATIGNGYNAVVMSFLEADFKDNLDRARLLADEIRQDGLLCVCFLTNETGTLVDNTSWLHTIVPVIDGPNTFLVAAWEPPDGGGWREDDASVEQFFQALQAISDRVAAAQGRRASPTGGHGQPGRWSAGEAGSNDREWLDTMHGAGLDVWFMQESIDSETIWHEAAPCGSDPTVEATGTGALFWYLGYCGAAGHASRGHFNRVCQQGIDVVLFEWTRSPAQHAAGVTRWRALIPAQPKPACSRGIM